MKSDCVPILFPLPVRVLFLGKRRNAHSNDDRDDTLQRRCALRSVLGTAITEHEMGYSDNGHRRQRVEHSEEERGPLRENSEVTEVHSHSREQEKDVEQGHTLSVHV